MAVIMKEFPGFTRDFLLWECSFQEFFLWNDRATEIITGNRVDMITETPEKIKSAFKWSPEKGRFI